MLHLVANLFTVIGYTVVVASLIYAGVALVRVVRLSRSDGQPHGAEPPVTILKPVCGLEPRLYENLRSFCEQDYPAYQILFGVRDAQDPAIPVIERLIREYPQRAPQLVVDPRVIGSNYKISNLANMIGLAQHDIMIVADADCRVGPHYLAELAAPFADSEVGAATCLYRGTPVHDRLADRLGAMFINEWFLPSVLVALITEPLKYCFGATMAVRREALQAIGGIEALASYLADDHMLGRLVAARGYKVALARPIVELGVAEPNLKALFLHELRWARTMRTVRPLSYAFSFLTDTLPLAILVGLATGLPAGGLILIGLALLLRIVTHGVVVATLGGGGDMRPWLVPLRDLMTFAIRAASFIGRDVEWRQHKFSVRSDGQIIVNS